jgi:hypothetical protein
MLPPVAHGFGLAAFPVPVAQGDVDLIASAHQHASLTVGSATPAKDMTRKKSTLPGVAALPAAFSISRMPLGSTV